MAKKVLFGMLAVLLAFGLVISCAEPFIDFSEVDGVPKTAKPDAPPAARAENSWKLIQGMWRTINTDVNAANVPITNFIEFTPKLYNKGEGTFKFTLNSNARFGIKSFSGIYTADVDNIQDYTPAGAGQTTRYHGEFSTFQVTSVDVLIGTTIHNFPIVDSAEAVKLAAEKLAIEKHMSAVLGLFIDGSGSPTSVTLADFDDDIAILFAATTVFIPVPNDDDYDLWLTFEEAIATIISLEADRVAVAKKQAALPSIALNDERFRGLLWNVYGSAYLAKLDDGFNHFLRTAVVESWSSVTTGAAPSTAAAVTPEQMTQWKTGFMNTVYDAASGDFYIKGFSKEPWMNDDLLHKETDFEKFKNWYLGAGNWDSDDEEVLWEFNNINDNGGEFEFWGGARTTANTTGMDTGSFTAYLGLVLSGQYWDITTAGHRDVAYGNPDFRAIGGFPSTRTAGQHNNTATADLAAAYTTFAAFIEDIRFLVGQPPILTAPSGTRPMGSSNISIPGPANSLKKRFVVRVYPDATSNNLNIANPTSVAAGVASWPAPSIVEGNDNFTR